jgi:biopolymer transport protein ExbD
MTPLIDVIFLLLLFFMLSSTFSRYSDVEMSLAGAAAGGAPTERAAFLRLGRDRIDLNGIPLEVEALAGKLAELEAQSLIVSVQPDVSAQRLTDLLVALRVAPGVDIVLLGDG